MSVERSKELFLTGHNCAQAVLGGFAENLGLTEEQALALASCFGAGISGTRGFCGALSGALMALGLHEKKISPNDKKAMYDEGKEIIAAFEEKFGTTVCKTLLENAHAYFEADPLIRNDEYYKSRPCLMFVELAAKLLSERL